MEHQWARRQAAEAQNHIWDSLGERYGLRIIPGSSSFLVLPNKVSRSSAVGSILRMHDVVIWGNAGPVVQGPSRQHVDTTAEPAVDFLLAMSRDDKLLARMNDLPGAETCSTSGQGCDAKWRFTETDEIVQLLLDLANSRV